MLVQTIKHGGGNVKTWGCFAWNDLGNLVSIGENMASKMYKSVLDKNLFQSSKKLQLGSGMVFQHDDDPKHAAHIVKHWLDENHVEHLIQCCQLFKFQMGYTEGTKSV